MQTEQPRQTEQLFAYQSGQPTAAPGSAAPDRKPLTVQCFHTPDGKLQRKIERLEGKTDEYAYTFDNKGRLTDVRLNGHPLETYRYNASGQRILQVCHHGGLRQNERQYRYNSDGRLARAGRTEFYYDRNGALGQRCDDGNAIFFEYGNGSRLDTAKRRDSWEIRYEYSPLAPQPIRRFKYGRLIHEYVWLDATRLSVCRDHDEDIEYQFSYDENGKLDRLRLVNLLHIDPRASAGMWGNPLPAGNAQDKARLKAARLDHFYEAMARNDRKSPRSLFDDSYAPREFLCCTDQVGTLRALVAPNGAVIKEIRRDSFGIPYYDSFPGFVLPIGFAGGLTDPDTGLVRFGWRDYDPAVGRFTALDPARDRRGDGDLYDYCMDDPVSRVDPTGLWSKANFDESQVHRDPEGKFAPTGAGSGSGGGGGGGIGDVAESSQATGAADNNYAPGTRIPRQAMQQAFEYTHYLRESLKAISEQEPELSFVDALVTGLGNIPNSFGSFVDDLCEAALHPGQTAEGIVNIVTGYGCQLFGIESESRAYSDIMTEYFYDRYGSYANFKKTLARDPVGVLCDMSLFLTGGGAVVRGGAKAGILASKLLPAGTIAQNVGKTAGVLGKIGTGLQSAGAKTDLLNLAGKAAGKLAGKTKITRFVPGVVRNNLSTVGVVAARVRDAASAGATVEAAKRKQEERENKK